MSTTAIVVVTVGASLGWAFSWAAVRVAQMSKSKEAP